MDAYDSDTESYLQASNCVIYATTIPTWSHSDEFTPDMPEKFFTLLYQEALAVCFNDIKQMPNIKHENNARNSKSRMHSNSQKFETKRVSTFGNNFGRK